MDAETLRSLQTPIKARYREDPATALFTMKAEGELGTGNVTCKVPTHAGAVVAGLHPAAGGDGSWACSGDMLLESLVACAGVTLRAVATAMGIDVRGGKVTAEGDVDFRGTLGVEKTVPVGFKAIRLRFHLKTDATPDQVANLVRLTERYCVIYQTLKTPPEMATTVETA